MTGARQHRREGARQGGSGPERTAPPAPRVVRHLRSGLTVRMTELGGRTRMTVHGEIDLDCAGMLHQALADCLTATPRGVDLDLSGVAFFDCAGLNALLGARALARATRAELNVTAVSAAVARVLDLTHCGEAFPLPARPSPAPVAGAAPWRAARPA